MWAWKRLIVAVPCLILLASSVAQTTPAVVCYSFLQGGDCIDPFAFTSCPSIPIYEGVCNFAIVDTAGDSTRTPYNTYCEWQTRKMMNGVCVNADIFTYWRECQVLSGGPCEIP